MIFPLLSVLRSARTCVGLVVLANALFATASLANAQNCNTDDVRATDRPALTIRLDNDALGGRRQDQNYTGGTIVTVMTPNLSSFTDDPCLSASLRWINQKLTLLQPDDVAQRNMLLGLAHLAFTPFDRLRSDVIGDDRPYSAALLFQVGYNGRVKDELTATHWRFGMIGPAAQGERVQNLYHDSLGLQRFNGWNNQLRNEVVVQLLHERMHRWSTASVRQGWGADLIGHWGGSLGNYATYANAGAELRLGWRLPDDFGTTPLRLAGQNTAPSSTYSQRTGWDGHLFLNIDGRGVVRDITLDGNTFVHSHHIAKRRWVADLGAGVALRFGPWRLAIGRYYRSREFDGQPDASAFGSLTVSRRI